MRGPTDEQVQAMYAYYQGGASLLKVGQRFHYSDGAILYHFRKHNLPTRSPYVTRRLASEAETRAMYADYETGLTLAEVGRKWGYSSVTVLIRFDNRGLPRRTPGSRKPRKHI